MITGKRGALLPDRSVYYCLSIAAADAPNLCTAAVHPHAWQALLEESYRVRGSRVAGRGARAAIVLPMFGRMVAVVADEGLGEDRFELR